MFKLKSVLYPPDATADKPEKINNSVLSGCCLWILCYHETFSIQWEDWDEFKPFFLYLFPRVWVFEICVWVSWKLTPWETNKEKRFKLVSIVLSKMFYGHAVFIGGNSQKGSRYSSFSPGLSLSRPVDTKTDFNLNNIIATLSLICISLVKQFAGKSPDTYSNLISTSLDKCQSWWVSTLRATRPWRHNLCMLPLVRCKTIDPFSTASSETQESYLTTGMLPYKLLSFFPPTNSSIMLPPHQPRLFAQLARWQWGMPYVDVNGV